MPVRMFSTFEENHSQVPLRLLFPNVKIDWNSRGYIIFVIIL